MFTIVDGDIFDSTEEYLCHQCNCVTQGAAHMAAAVFKRFPYADIYSGRDEPDEPGTAIIRGGGDNRIIVNLLGQYFPGNVRYPDANLDGFATRLRYFREALFQACQELPKEGSWAFPWRIGCGAAGGDWGTYIEVLKDFELFVNKRDSRANVTIYKLPHRVG